MWRGRRPRGLGLASLRGVRLDPDEREWVFRAVAEERRAIAELVDGRGVDQLETASLCAGWDVGT